MRVLGRLLAPPAHEVVALEVVDAHALERVSRELVPGDPPVVVAVGGYGEAEATGSEVRLDAALLELAPLVGDGGRGVALDHPVAGYGTNAGEGEDHHERRADPAGGRLP